MRSSLIAIGLALTLATGVFAQPAQVRSPTWASGKVAKVDIRIHSLVIRQGTHQMTFTLPADTRFMRGRQRLRLDELAHDVGDDVMISYTTLGGTRVAQRVVIVERTH
jgi:hypothetical protein